MALLLLLIPTFVMGDLASIKVGINEVALAEGFKVLENVLHLIPLGNHSVNASGLILNLTNLVMNNTLAVTEESFLILEPCTIQINFTDLNSIITFNYSENGKLPGKGNITFPDSFLLLQFVVSVLGGGIQLDLTPDSNIILGKAIVTTGLGKIINAELAKQINTATFLIENTIMALIEPFLAGTVNPVLYSVAKLIPVPPVSLMYNISITDESLIEGTYATLPIRGEFLIYPFRTRFFPFLTVPLPSISSSNYPLQLLVSDYNLAAPLTAIWSEFHMNLTKFPPVLPLELTTDGLAFILPGLKKQFGSNKPVMIGITPCPYWGVPLNLTIPNGVLDLDLGVRLDFYVNVSQTQVAYALTLFQQIQLKATLSELDFVGQFNIASLNLLNNTLGPNNTAPVNMPILNKTLQLLVKTLLPVINALGYEFQIPAPSIPFVNITQNKIGLINRGILLEAGIKLDLDSKLLKGYKIR